MSASSRSRSVLLAAGTAVAAITLTSCGTGGTSSSSGSGTNLVNADVGATLEKEGDRREAPRLVGETLDGKKLDTADFRGKILVFNVWGSWCGPCRAEADHLVKVSSELTEDGVQFIGINTRDPQISPALAFEKNYEIPYPSLHDPAGKLLLRFPKGTLNAQTIPTTLFVDRYGRIAGRIIGGASEERLREILKPLLAE
ncbi:TlpA family protein disulfide reductase (plasmid) [Streptomyces sp. NBC_01362]|uniref:TlpA family protein disulfide reductase n=1 Tax=Streptomyces sp. NBC_01362 TaxID=2903839 RepID=UPI002E373504|nr:TlpA disulfide reductase family protein [Streptomyces sp. NBC_01362]